MSLLLVLYNKAEQRLLVVRCSLCSSRSEEQLLADFLGVLWTGDLVANGARVRVDLIVVSSLQDTQTHIDIVLNDEVYITANVRLCCY